MKLTSIFDKTPAFLSCLQMFNKKRLAQYGIFSNVQ